MAAEVVVECVAATGTVAGILAGRVVVITAGDIAITVGIGSRQFRAVPQGGPPLGRGGACCGRSRDLFAQSHKSSRLCENSDATLTNPVFVEFSPVLSDQKPANHKNSL
jgi:hypothetical protein